MDWNAAIERNREALKRILATLVAMAGLGNTQAAIASRQPGSGPAQAADGPTDCLLPTADRRLLLPRHLYRAVLRLLRPAEGAARRLVIVAARAVVVPPPAPPRPRKPQPKSALLRNGVGTGIVMPNLPPQAGLRPPAQCTLCLPLLDPLRLPRLRRPAASGVPRILFPGFGAPVPVPVRRPPSPDDQIDASRLALRLAALGRALDDLPAQARRFARWKIRRDRNMVRRVWPLRPGRPPGGRSARSRLPVHEVHDVLGDLQWFAVKALQSPDTS